MRFANRLKKTLWMLIAVAVTLFLASWVIYFFNLDMKVAAAVQPLLNKIYDYRKREPLP